MKVIGVFIVLIVVFDVEKMEYIYLMEFCFFIFLVLMKFINF